MPGDHLEYGPNLRQSATRQILMCQLRCECDEIPRVGLSPTGVLPACADANDQWHFRRSGVLEYMAMRPSRGTYLLAALVAAGFPSAVAAQSMTRSGAVQWHCVQELDAGYHVTCVPSSTTQPRESHPTSIDPGDVVNRIVAGPDMRPVTERGHTEVFSTDAWRVPLHAAPSDVAMVNALLVSVLCGRHPACRVDYSAGPLRVARKS